MQMSEIPERELTLDEIDLYPTALYATGRPHAALRLLRAQQPVWRQEAPDGTEFVSVTRYDDVVDVLRDTRRFSSEHSTMLSVLHRDAATGKAIHLTDPPRHTRVRSTTIQSMSRRVMRAHEDAIRQRVRAMVTDAVRQRELDFAKVVSRLPMLVAGELMGIPEEKWAEAAHWTIASMAAEDPAYSIGNENATLRAAHVFLFSMFVELINARRERPGTNDLISLLMGMEVDGTPLTDEHILVNCYAFIMGANPTIPQAASHLVLAMAENPSLWKQIRSTPALFGSTLAETLRWASPVNHLLRRTTEEVRIGDEVVPEGGLVAAWIASANRDESVFADPYVFDPARQPNPHIAFGLGAHRCIGNSAAQTGIRLLIEELSSTVDYLELAGEVRHLGSNFLNGVTSLPVVLYPADGAGA